MTVKYGSNLGLLLSAAPGEQHKNALDLQNAGVDSLIQPVAKSITTIAPPATPADGDTYVVPASATGAWAGQTGKIARWMAADATNGITQTWLFYTPKKGWRIFVQDAAAGVGQDYQYNGTAWAVASGGGGGPASTDGLTEGSTNLYFTEPRVRATLLAGWAVGSNTALAATDSVLAAFGKVQGQINARLTDAPSDGSEYVRKNGAWAIATGGGGGSSTLAGLTDVTISSPLNGYDLIYDSTTSKWVSKPRYNVSATGSSPRALTVADANALIDLQNATSNTVTVPANATQAIPIGVPITLRQDGAGPITLSPAGGVTFSTGSPTATVARGDVLVLVKTATNTWDTFYQAATVGEPAIAGGTAVQYWKGNKTWGTFATDVRNAVLSGYSVGSNAALANTDGVEAAFGKVQGQMNARANGSDYIDGLRLVWNSATSISVSSGSAFIASSASILNANSTLTLSSLSLSASTWYHLYLYSNSGTPAIECVTTAPAAAYNGTARAKTGDTSRRYLGSVLTDSTGNIYNFTHVGNDFSFVAATDAAPFRVLANGTSTTGADISCSSAVPTTAQIALFNFFNLSTAGANLCITPAASYSLKLTKVLASNGIPGRISVGSSRVIGYVYEAAPTTLGAYVDITGHVLER